MTIRIHLYMGENEAAKQFVGELEFFLNTDKPIVSIPLELYFTYENALEHFPKYADERCGKMVLAKLPEYVEKYRDAFIVGGRHKLTTLGKLYGYPLTAVETFHTDLDAERIRVGYYGLNFVGLKRDEKQIKEELDQMYGWDTKNTRVSPMKSYNQALKEKNAQQASERER